MTSELGGEYQNTPGGAAQATIDSRPEKLCVLEGCVSSYGKFFAQDFGERCRDLLALLPEGRRHKREVTLLLAIAAAGLVIPHERLSYDSGDPEGRKGQPGMDRDRFRLQGQQLRDELDKPFEGNCRITFLESALGDPEQWVKHSSGESVTPTRLLVVKTIRHALAHGNIVARPPKGSIEELLFVCGYPPAPKQQLDKRLRCLSVTPEDLEAFLIQWFTLLGDLQAYPESVAEALGSEAA